MNVEINIDELVLHGFAPGDRYKIGQAVEHELERLVREQGLPGTWPAGRNVDRLNAGTFSIKEGTRAESIGIQAAKTVYGGLKL
jgi:hypothetical protein